MSTRTWPQHCRWVHTTAFFNMYTPAAAAAAAVSLLQHACCRCRPQRCADYLRPALHFSSAAHRHHHHRIAITINNIITSSSSSTSTRMSQLNEHHVTSAPAAGSTAGCKQATQATRADFTPCPSPTILTSTIATTPALHSPCCCASPRCRVPPDCGPPHHDLHWNRRQQAGAALRGAHDIRDHQEHPAERLDGGIG